MKKSFLFTLLTIVIAAITKAQDKPLQWLPVQPGIWKATLGKSPSFSLLTVMENHPRTEALKQLPSAPFPLSPEDIVGSVVNGKTTIHFPLEQHEAIFGLGLNFKTVNQRGRILHLHMDHYGNSDNGRSHAPVPFYVSSKGYGVLVDAAQYMTFYIGTSNRKESRHPPVIKDRNTDTTWEAQPYSDAIEVNVPGESVDVYLFSGPTTMNVVQRYNLFNGGGCLPPKWGLGFTQRVPTLYNQDDVLREVNEFEEHHFPLDFIGLEPGWQSSSYPCTLEWDSTRFPHPKELLDQLAKKGVRTNLWFNPYLSPSSELYKKILPLSGSHTVWNGIVPDITLSQTRQLLKDHFIKNHINPGVAAYKIDEVDGYDNWLWPDVASFPSGNSAEQMRQVYGSLWQKLTFEWFKERNQRTYGLVRGSNAGSSSMPYVIYNDYYSHRDFITALINSSFIGVLWVPEVRASESAEEWVRRMQTVCFSPMAMLDAWSDGTKPWTYPEVENAVTSVAMLRMQLLPYLYTSFAQYHFEGKPPFRSMSLADGIGFIDTIRKESRDASKNGCTLEAISAIRDQYMEGDFVLVAPLFAGELKRKVYLPAGKWFDFYTGAYVGENEVIETSAGLDRIPLFVKDGGIIPMIPATRQTPREVQLLPLEVRYYGTTENEFVLYDDDGVSFNYEKGEFSKTILKVTRDKKGQLRGNQPVAVKGKPYHYQPQVSWRFMTTQFASSH